MEYMLKRNIACLTFLVNEQHKSIKEIVSENINLEQFVFNDYFTLEDILIQLTEFLLGQSVEVHSLIQCKNAGSETAVELWVEETGFTVKFYKEDKFIKSVRADEFIKNFRDIEEFHIYLSDFLRTEHYWVNGYTPRIVEPEQRVEVVVNLLEKRLTNMEQELSQTRSTIKSLEAKIEDQKETILQLISLMERLNSRRGG